MEGGVTLGCREESSCLFFIAWLEGDNRENLENEYDEVYNGLHLFVAGYTEKIEDVIDTLYKIGDRRFQNEAVGFFI